MAAKSRPIWRSAANPIELRIVGQLDRTIKEHRRTITQAINKKRVIMARCATRAWRHRQRG